jgi:hypothetical protein
MYEQSEARWLDFPSEFTITERWSSPLERFFRLSMVVLLMLHTDCSFFARKPATSSRLLPPSARGQGVNLGKVLTDL